MERNQREEDPFDALLHIEETMVQLGKQNGRLNADQTAFEEGRRLGLVKGAEIGRELGFYCGHLLVWERLLLPSLPSSSASPSSSSPSSSSSSEPAEEAGGAAVQRAGRGARAEEAVGQLRELLAAFPADPTREDLFERLDRIRGKYRQAASLLRAPPSARYPPSPAPTDPSAEGGVPVAGMQRLHF